MTIKEIKRAKAHNATVYYVNTDTLDILRGTITGISQYNSDVWLELEINWNESICQKDYDETVVDANDVFMNMDDALNYQESQRQSKIAQYYREIKNIEDLLIFPLDHRLNRDDDYDDCALEAYLKRARELCNINIL